MELQRLVNVLVPITLIEMMIAIGLGVAVGEVLAVARDWRLLVRAALANYVCVPAVTLGLLLLFHANPMVAVGFLILAACPGAPFGPPVTAIARGNMAAAVGLMIVLAGSSALLAPLILRLCVPLIAGDARGAGVDATKLVTTLLVTQLIPLCAGLGVRQLCPTAAARMLKPANRLSALLTLVTISLILVLRYQTLLAIRPRGVFGMLALLAASLAIGWLLSSPGRENRRAMALTTSLRNIGVGLVIANDAFAGTPALTAVVAYGLFEVTGSLIVAVGLARLAPTHRLALAAVR